MNKVDIGIGDYYSTGDTETLLKTYALGSCVAVIIYDPVNKITGMIHVALPDSKVNPAKADTKPGYFVDTGLPLLLNGMKELGAEKKHLKIKLVGGSRILDEKGTFDIGKRNHLAVKKVLWRYGLGAIAEDVGGSISRTVSIDPSDGTVLISNAKKTWSI